MINYIDELKTIKQDPAKEVNEEQLKYSVSQTQNTELEKFYNKIHQEVINNLDLSENLRIEINKLDFTNKDIVIEKCLSCISKMTSDKLFYEMNINKLK
jgi:deoxyadenosine/deoxycytidine kinase